MSGMDPMVFMNDPDALHTIVALAITDEVRRQQEDRDQNLAVRIANEVILRFSGKSKRS